MPVSLTAPHGGTAQVTNDSPVTRHTCCAAAHAGEGLEGPSSGLQTGRAIEIGPRKRVSREARPVLPAIVGCSLRIPPRCRPPTKVRAIVHKMGAFHMHFSTYYPFMQVHITRVLPGPAWRRRYRTSRRTCRGRVIVCTMPGKPCLSKRGRLDIQHGSVAVVPAGIDLMVPGWSMAIRYTCWDTAELQKDVATLQRGHKIGLGFLMGLCNSGAKPVPGGCRLRWTLWTHPPCSVQGGLCPYVALGMGVFVGIGTNPPDAAAIGRIRIRRGT